MQTFLIALVVSAPALLATLALMVMIVRVNRTVNLVHHEVKTMNAQSIAEIADADETRRIEAIPLDDRTKIERSHMRSVEHEREEGT